MATVKEKSIAERLKALYSLQQIDSKLDSIVVLKGELPMEVSDLEDEISGIQTRIKKHENAIAEVDNEILKHNTNINNSKLTIE